jgi:hypothetical protein
MEVSQIYVLISIIILLIVIVLLILVKGNKKQKLLTPLAGIAFAFILAGIIFGDNKLIGYSLLGFGVLLAVIDMIIELKKNK